jgi:hypothetical protein
MPGENLMLLIGIDKYPGSKYRSLDNCVADVKRFGGIMEDRYGFRVFDKPLYDEQATRSNIIEALNSLAAFTTPEDNVIISFAGHGDKHPSSRNGFWVPIDWTKVSDSVFNSTIYDMLEGISAKHIFLISDSCYSGTFITRIRGVEKTLSHDELEAMDSRWVFTSGSEENVGDGRRGTGSPFNRNLCDFLQNNQASSVAIGEMCEAVTRMVKAGSKQTPLYELIRMPSNKGGQMILRLGATRSAWKVTIAKQSFSLPANLFDYYMSRTVTYYDYKRSEIAYFFDNGNNNEFLQDALLLHSRIALLGSAGSGKSVELIRLANLLDGSETAYVPIYKRFNTYTGQDVEDFLPKGWEEVTTASAVILLDGLDEIQSDFIFTGIRKIIEFCNKRPALRIIISCRTNFYELPNANYSGTLEGFSVFTLNDISLGEIREYADKILQLDGPEFIKDVYDASLLDVIQKPYFLDLLTKYYLDNGNFPSNRAVIYEEALLKYYLTDKEHFKMTSELLGKAETFSLLEKLAFVMEVMGKNFITDDELYKVFASPKDLEKCKYLPAFKKQEKTGQWMFVHNNIQEFLAARVLSQKPFNKMIDIISIRSAGKKRVKPTWANTLSFFISIGKKQDTARVLEWVAENDVELLIRFEPERIDEQKRLDVFKQVFENYSKKQIWLSSNKFSDADLAKFAWMDGAIEYLIETINNKQNSRITKLNAIRVLDNYNLKYFQHFVPIIKKTLIDLLANEDFSANDLYATIGALANLQITDKETVDFVINKFRKRKNQYIRAGVYKLLHQSDHLEDYLEVLFDGLDLGKIENADDDRDPVNLMDERLHLTTALGKIKTAEGLIQLLTYFADEKSRQFFYSDYKEIIGAIIENSVAAYKSDKSIYTYVRDYFIKLEHFFNKNSSKLILPFFEQTGTKWDLFHDIWTNKSIENYTKGELIEALVTETIISQFAAGYAKGEYSAGDAEQLHQILFWRGQNHPEFSQYLVRLEETFQTNFNVKLERPVLRNYNELYKKQIQDAFDLLFDKERFLKKVKNVFTEIGKDELNVHELYNYRSSQPGDLEKAFITSAVELIRNFTFHGRSVTVEEIELFFQNEKAFYDYQVDAIYEYLHGTNVSLIEVSETQLEFISKWCEENGDVTKILWFFIHHFTIRLEESKLLDLTFYYDYNSESKFADPGTIEKLETFLPRQSLKKKVRDNMLGDTKDASAWLSNAGYALRHNIKEAYTRILTHLQGVDGNEFKYNELLEYWFSKTNDAKSLARFIELVRSDVLRWQGIALLSNSGRENTLLMNYLKRIMNNEAESRDSRFTAANYLMAMDDLEAIAFCAGQILKNPNPRIDFRHDLHKMSLLKNAGAIAWLMQLLHLAKLPEYQTDRFNSLESVVVDTLYNIGIESDDNFILVSDAVLQFITQNERKLENLNFLHFTLQRMEEQLNMKKAQDYSVEQALYQWEKSV